jgi:2-dehydropantoate 2-reductase
MKMNIAVIGVGGVGGYFGGKLTQLLNDDPDMRIFFIARGNHLEEIRKNGLLLDTDERQIICKPTLATDDISELPLLDLCLIGVKSYDLEDILIRLRPKITGLTVILPLLNGVDIYERIRSIIGNGNVLPSSVYVGTHIEKPGKVTQRGGFCTIVFGNDPKKENDITFVTDTLKRANIRFSLSENPYVEIWGKFIFIASFGLVTACFDKTIGEVLESEELSSHVKKIMKEIVDIANAKRIPLPPSIIDESFTKARSFPLGTKTSFQRDYEIPGKKDERDLFGGAIIRMGEQLGINTETTEMIYELLQKGKHPIDSAIRTLKM